MAMLKVFEFSGAETDWIAANTEDDARDFLMRHYGISAEDVAMSYEEVFEVSPDTVFNTDEYDEEEEETVTTTAAELVKGKTKPFFIGSTYQ